MAKSIYILVSKNDGSYFNIVYGTTEPIIVTKSALSLARKWDTIDDLFNSLKRIASNSNKEYKNKIYRAILEDFLIHKYSFDDEIEPVFYMNELMKNA